MNNRLEEEKLTKTITGQNATDIQTSKKKKKKRTLEVV